jgi:hypothetical protein
MLTDRQAGGARIAPVPEMRVRVPEVATPIPFAPRPAGWIDGPRPSAADDCPYAKAQALLAWWRGLARGGGRWPDWRTIDKTTLKPWMGWLCRYDVLDGGRDYRYRLVGEWLSRGSGQDLTGELVSRRVYAPSPWAMLCHMTCLMEHADAAWFRRALPSDRGYSVLKDRLWLPFANGADAIGLWMMYLCADEVLVHPLDRAR